MLFLAVPRSSLRNESFHRYLNSFVPFLRRRSAREHGTEVAEDDDEGGGEGGGGKGGGYDRQWDDIKNHNAGILT